MVPPGYLAALIYDIAAKYHLIMLLLSCHNLQDKDDHDVSD